MPGYVPPPQPQAAPAKPKEWTPAQYGGYVPPEGGGGGQVLIKSVNGKVVITPGPGTGTNPPLSSNTNTSSNSNPAPASKKQSSTINQTKVTQAQPAPKKPLGPVARPTPPPASSAPAVPPVSNGIADGDHAPVVNGNKNIC